MLSTSCSPTRGSSPGGRAARAKGGRGCAGRGIRGLSGRAIRARRYTRGAIRRSPPVSTTDVHNPFTLSPAVPLKGIPRGCPHQEADAEGRHATWGVPARTASFACTHGALGIDCRETRAPRELLKASVPSLLYTAQNNLLFIGLSHLSARGRERQLEIYRRFRQTRHQGDGQLITRAMLTAVILVEHFAAQYLQRRAARRPMSSRHAASGLAGDSSKDR